MAYDLFLKTQIAKKNYARGDEPPRKRSPVSSAMSFGLASFVLILPSYLRHREVSQYRREYATDLPVTANPRQRSYAEKRLHTTLELPAIPMSDLVYGSQQAE
jgi:hypothetical protein